LGAGGGLFVNQNANVTITNVSFSHSVAAGGAGGGALGGSGGGGGMGGVGGSSVAAGGSGGGGGLFFQGGNGGPPGFPSGGGGGISSAGSNGGALGGNGGTGVATIGGGGGGGGFGIPGSGGTAGGSGAVNGNQNNGGSGGFGGGGGGGVSVGGTGGFGGGGGGGNVESGAGGFGGGGGAGGGIGGFGGGGGRDSGGFGGIGGNGFGGGIGSGFGGGGGGGLGGAVFVVAGGNLSIAGQGGTTSSNNVTGGAAGDSFAGTGSAFGQDIFIQGTNTVIFAPGVGNTYTIVNDITDQNANGGSGATAGIGSVAVNGGGTLVLSGNSTYTGTTTVNDATLVVNGSISAPVINSGGILTGTGTVGATQVNANGTFAPGNGTPGSSMTVSSLSLAGGAFYMVQLNPTTSSFAAVAGTATLGGANVDAFYAAGSYVAKQYTILTAGNVSGTFGSLVNTNLPTGFKTSLSYDGTDAYLNLILSFIPPPGSGLSGNQQNVGNAIVSFFNSNGSIPLVFGGLTSAGLTQLSGETATGSQQTTFNAMNQFMGVLTDPFIDGRGDGMSGGGSSATGYASTRKTGAARDANAMFTKAIPPAATFDQRWSVWAAGFGGSQTTSGNATLGSNDATSRIYGTAVGADYRFSPFTIAGFALAGGGTSFSVANAGTGRSDLFQAGAFIRHNAGPAYISAALAYGWQDVTTNRTVTVAGSDMLQARFNANAWSGRLEGGYRYATPLMGITPYATAQFTTFELPAYAEGVLSGAGTFALSYAAKSVTDTRSELGIRTDKSYALTNSILTLRGRLAWAHDYDPDRSIGATFQTLPGASFVVNGVAQAHDSALTTASAEIKWMNGWSAAATFEGEFSVVTNSYAGKGVARYQW
jgi:uncharacterized protein with beta-barrel porin domain